MAAGADHGELVGGALGDRGTVPASRPGPGSAGPAAGRSGRRARTGRSGAHPSAPASPARPSGRRRSPAGFRPGGAGRPPRSCRGSRATEPRAATSASSSARPRVGKSAAQAASAGASISTECSSIGGSSCSGVSQGPVRGHPRLLSSLEAAPRPARRKRSSKAAAARRPGGPLIAGDGQIDGAAGGGDSVDQDRDVPAASDPDVGGLPAGSPAAGPSPPRRKPR